MNNKKILNSLSIIILVVCFFIISAFAYSEKIINSLSSSFIRLHVIANSDSDYDQEVKLKVRDAILKYMTEKSIDLNNIDEAKILINKNIEELQQIANTVLKENGFNYNSKAILGNFNFPTKEYGDIILPSGEYEALRIVLGNGNGQNWWCVMFPPLCFVDNSNNPVSENSKQQIKSNLNDEEYSLITSNSEDATNDIKFKFKIVEIFQRDNVNLANK